MSREQYTPPSLSQGGNNNAGGSTGGGFAISGNSFEDTGKPVQYLCGDCDTKVALKKGDPIRCKECGYRVLYKERTNRMIQFEAR
ncbi:DNA-directed RNA polymerases II, IV and V subunit 12 [Fulvia fulva]|uniref:DNA-directed RNA polymerases II, IV and V subunit 12 n=1 Tax=Passalora fulva TaxID=5499 RepID=A0A9Q8L5Y0_PASFU|nr:DNA-directed RNA polymerases II, IV and V subunit 12 [Fulvia fulva]KAK4635598.1 DNA-directed RNA polymerases II, IV and V subunit 12 [Fulvia fulva]KAK4637338.1 DNA-directed RNA polymerases II, IV and V subunit 12 [Fulvia fulva]UJO11470.1 DNA-directed RNA polymerases II, IV and V subunit 12 [Fulvia fulva]WPV08759.1 DNA-directed RNA polymerases II, IV and V subunit 12 [Fulvia fulva]WPV24598.1 DNA-directed RNA polymerases II, IV and V subunit 12 [Fulvia fulva]